MVSAFVWYGRTRPGRKRMSAAGSKGRAPTPSTTSSPAAATSSCRPWQISGGTVSGS